jgi:transcription initiation factor TFIIB
MNVETIQPIISATNFSDDDEIWNNLEMLSSTHQEDSDNQDEAYIHFDIASSDQKTITKQQLHNKQKQKELNYRNISDTHFTCSNCGEINENILTEGVFVCKKCFTLENRFIDGNAEWRYYGYEDNKASNPTRVGTPSNIFIPKSSLGTIIGTENVKSNGYEFQRIRRYQMFQSMPYKERSLLHVMESMNASASNYGIPSSIIEDAKMMYKNVSDKKISRGDNRNGLIASSVYMSCKTNKVPRSAKEIANMFNLNITTMTKGCKKFHDLTKIVTQSSDPNDFIVRFCSKLNKNDIVELCMYVIEKSEEFSIVSENAPPSIAAGCIYLVSVCCELNISKKEIAKACEISEVTINKCYKKLYKYRNYLFPKSVIMKEDPQSKK